MCDECATDDQRCAFQRYRNHVDLLRDALEPAPTPGTAPSCTAPAPPTIRSYMSGLGPSLVQNSACCVGTNSVHVVHLKAGVSPRALFDAWSSDLTALSCEIEGHPLGGGLLKLEPTRAARVLVDKRAAAGLSGNVAARGLATMRRWRGVKSAGDGY
jgi:hypothetical protein